MSLEMVRCYMWILMEPGLREQRKMVSGMVRVGKKSLMAR